MPPIAPQITTTVANILDRALDGEDISPQDGLTLLEQTDPTLIEAIRVGADRLRQQQVGDTVTFVINRNINYTNICEQHCSFCAFRRDQGQPGAYWLSWETILGKATAAVAEGATEICMQGGLNPTAKINGLALTYYQRLVRTIKDQFPALHIHAFSPQEVQFIAREDNLDFATVIQELAQAGVDSLPGTAAEVLDDRVRRVICPEKTDTATWVAIVSQAHRLGLPTTSTLMSGHIETKAQQIAHLDQLRRLQQQSLAHGPTGITEFILLPFVGQDAPKPLRSRVGRDQPVIPDALLLTAVARIYLGHWIKNHQPSWVKLGLGAATEALRWGCNDIGGTLMEEHITSMAGAQGGTCQSVEDLAGAIATLKRPSHQRDTLYNLI
ncbi:7,8-didemethyl-8-hydroxy-5-deazariboflavin synthase subunit CofH [Leptothoe sp. PORK10 BA2]|uniref:7,8-didemethyl-8-hydroxy-5-deazariboflavin synthase subunit CofH n=1 Tax=Leptothoe sp. PORK10 BA2 TaxID=3110254 RepID=UPI002B21280A|nr:7,8-didemethyl-8-hydroxy-5-deazariboflavin synthase subunit CofH [Leptothoe sp. PORK10 BA2]MEA5462639.1 7,8-didemethyl-8-hydroxy-5-deazariboflavin synthase subunit CofH [Leptothoe sp. PORK10 BA2]